MATCTRLGHSPTAPPSSPRTRFVEDLLIEEGIGQYVLLGAGLDTFAQRHTELAGHVRVFEIDQPGPQAWKRQRLEELGYGVLEHLRLIPVDFEADGDWWQELLASGFDSEPGPRVVQWRDDVHHEGRDGRNASPPRRDGTRLDRRHDVHASVRARRRGRPSRPRGGGAGCCRLGHPLDHFYAPDEIVTLAHDAGLADARYIPTADLAERYLSGRTDDLRAAGGEGILLART